MMNNFDDMQKLGQSNLDATAKALGSFSKTAQTIATEMTDYSKKSFEEGAKAVEHLLGARTVEQAVQIQTDYAKVAYGQFVAQASRIGQLYAELATDAYRSFESNLGRTTPQR